MATCAASAFPEKVVASPSIAWRFQAAIIVWWIACLADNSASDLVAKSDSFQIRKEIMPLVLHLPAQHDTAPSLMRRLRRAMATWSSGMRPGTCVLQDEAHLREMDPRLFANVGLAREDVARSAPQRV